MSYHTPQEPPDWVLERIRTKFKYYPNRKRNAVKRVSHKGVGYGNPNNKGYILFFISRKGKQYGVLAHHIAFYLYRHRYEWPTQSLDHINGDILDNRIKNLRLASHSQNQMNKGVQSNNTSGHPGVIWNKNRCKWLVLIGKDGKQHYFGYFHDYDEAVAVAKRERRRLFGKFDPQH